MTSQLERQLRAILAEHPQGIPEHTLLKRLQVDNPDSFPDTVFRDDLALFRAHFLLFHALYRLRDSLHATGQATLRIDPCGICLLPLDVAEGRVLTDPDPMRDYYLDLSHLTDTSADEVEQLLGGFWVRFYAGSRRTEALAVLGLGADADLATAQRRYRELAMAHHPDRGGDVASFQAIQEAMAVLRRC